MKRGDIETGVVYGYSEDRGRISHYSPYMVLSTASFYRPRYGTTRNILQPAPVACERLNRGGWRTHTDPVGLLAVFVTAAGLANLDRLRELATIDGALIALNDDTRDINDGVDAQTGQPVHLGSYRLITNSGDLHGFYVNLVAEQQERERRNNDAAQQHEEARLTALATFNALSARVAALGLNPDYRSDYDHPGHYRLNFEDMAALLTMAEQGHHV